MKSLKIFLILLLIPSYVFSLSGCSDDEPEGQLNHTFSINEADLQQDFAKEQGLLSINVNTTLSDEEWNVKSNQPWCIAAKDLSTSTPSIKILIKENQEPDIREAVVSVKSSVNSYEIKVRQLGYGPAILVKSSSMNIEAAGGEVTITVTSNVDGGKINRKRLA